MIKTWIFYNFETDIKLDFLFVKILGYIWWSLHSSILFMGMGKRWRKVICVVKLSHRTTTHIKPEIFQISDSQRADSQRVPTKINKNDAVA